MKYIIIGVLGVGIIGGITLYKPQTIEYINPEPQVVELEVQVDALEKAIKDAQETKRDEAESVAKKAYEDALIQEMKKIELQVISDFNKKLDARQIELEKETKVY